MRCSSRETARANARDHLIPLRVLVQLSAHPLAVAPGPLGKPFHFSRTQWLSDIRIVAIGLLHSPKARPDLDVPSKGLVRVCLQLAPYLITDRRGFLRYIIRRQGTLSDPQVRPTLFDFGQLKRMQPLCLVALAEREGLPHRSQKPNKIRHFLQARWRRVYQSCVPKSTGFCSVNWGVNS
jgi:hypothetical protein